MLFFELSGLKQSVIGVFLSQKKEFIRPLTEGSTNRLTRSAELL